MKKLVFICCGWWLVSTAEAQVPLPQVSSGQIKRFENFPSRWVDARNVDVWLPPGYDVKKRYPVLYMHDGQMLFDSTTTWNKQEWGVDETLGDLILGDKIRSCIVVGVWNSGAKRHVDYFPQKPYELLSAEAQDTLLKTVRPSGVDVFVARPQSDAYLKFLVKELKPFIDRTFSTLRNRHNTFIAGSSMGGLISLYAISKYPKVFGGAACLSTHWPGIFSITNNPVPDAFMRYWADGLPPASSHRIYFDYGMRTLDAWYEPYQLQMDSLMVKRGYRRGVNWITEKFPMDDHSEKAWRGRLAGPMLFLLRK